MPPKGAQDGDAKQLETIQFKDSVGRKFRFPFEVVKTWSVSWHHSIPARHSGSPSRPFEARTESHAEQGMEKLIKQPFLNDNRIGGQVHSGHYDLIDPEGEIILPQTWKYFVRPDWSIEMKVWPRPGPPMPPPFPRRFPPGVGPKPHPPPSPPPGWSRPISHNVPTNGPGTTSAPMQLPFEVPPRATPQELVHLGHPQRSKKKSSKRKQPSLLSWIAGAAPKKNGSVATRSDDEAPPEHHEAPLPVQSPPPPMAEPPDLRGVSLSEGGVRRSTLANEMAIVPFVPRNVGDRSFNLRPKKKHAQSRSVPSLRLSSSSSTASSGSSTAASEQSVSSTRTMAEGDARRLISQRRLIVKCAVSSQPLRRPTTALNIGNTKMARNPPDVLELSTAQIRRDGFEKMAFTTLELVKQRPMRAPPSKERDQTGDSTMTWK